MSLKHLCFPLTSTLLRTSEGRGRLCPGHCLDSSLPCCSRNSLRPKAGITVHHHHHRHHNHRHSPCCHHSESASKATGFTVDFHTFLPLHIVLINPLPPSPTLSISFLLPNSLAFCFDTAWISPSSPSPLLPYESSLPLFLFLLS